MSDERINNNATDSNDCGKRCQFGIRLVHAFFPIEARVLLMSELWRVNTSGQSATSSFRAAKGRV